MPLLARTVAHAAAPSTSGGVPSPPGRASWPTGASPPAATWPSWSGPGQGEQIADLLGPSLHAADIFTVAGGTLDAALDLGAQAAGPLLRRGGRHRRRQDHRHRQVRRDPRTACPMVTVATSLANDGIASPVATLDHDGGARLLRRAHPDRRRGRPRLRRAGPGRQTRAGIGDAAQQHQRARRLGAGPPRYAASRSTAWPCRWPASAPRRCSTTRAT